MDIGGSISDLGLCLRRDLLKIAGGCLDLDALGDALWLFGDLGDSRLGVQQCALVLCHGCYRRG